MPVGITSRGTFKGPRIKIIVDSALNGDSLELTIFEDTNGDGTADNTETFTVTGGSQSFTSGNLSFAQGNDVWYALDASDADTDITTATDNVTVEIQT